MGLRDRLRVASEGGIQRLPPKRDIHPAGTGAGSVRHSNGLKDFLWLIGDVPRGRILDLGPAWQSTIAFFTERGFGVTTDDVLRSWSDAQRREMEDRATKPVEEWVDPPALAERFCRENLQFPAETFNGVLVWDLCDYLEPEVLSRVAARLHELLKPNGALLALFHNSMAGEFNRYRLIDQENIEILPAPLLLRMQRVFQNREILSLFSRFRSSRTYVGRDQLREALFTK